MNPLTLDSLNRYTLLKMKALCHTYGWYCPKGHVIVKPSGAEIVIFCANQLNTIAADALAPSISRLAAGMVLDM